MIQRRLKITIPMGLVVVITCVNQLAGQAMSADPQSLVGLKAPEFRLSGTDRQTHRLSDALAKGPAVVCWFPKAYTGNTEIMLRSLNGIKTNLDAQAIALMAISCDKTKYLRPFATELSLQYPILADPTRTIAIQWTVAGDGRELPNRWIFFIDEKGRIAAVLSDFQAERAGESVLAKVRELGWLK